MKNFQAIIDTPFAQLAIQTQKKVDEFVTSIDFLPVGSEKPFSKSHFTDLLAHEINAYLQNSNHCFEIRLLASGTKFQQSVWQIMQTIESGKTLTYGEVAAQLKSSPRAVGNACRRNPIPLLIPCHRIVAKNGLGGFAGHVSGDVFDIKRWLLTLEMWLSTENHQKNVN